MVISRVSSFSSSSFFFGSILSQEKEVRILLIVSLLKLAHTQLSFTFSSCRKELRIAISTTVWFLCSDRSLVWSSSLWSLAKFTNTYKKEGHVTHHPGFSLIQGISYTGLPELVL